jgi:phosphohistidine phosphatase
MKLYLVQHGEAASKDVDPERPLTNQGRLDVEGMGAFLKRSGVQVRRVIHSGKLRAQQTAELLATFVAPEVEPEVSGLMNPNDNPRAFDWQSESWDQDTLIVGHLPFMVGLVSHLLIDDDSKALVAYQPGSVVCLEHDDGQWQLDWMVRPELMK